MISFHDSFQQKPSCGRRLSLGATLFLACLALALGDSGAAQTLDCKIRNILTDGSPPLVMTTSLAAQAIKQVE